MLGTFTANKRASLALDLATLRAGPPGSAHFLSHRRTRCKCPREDFPQVAHPPAEKTQQVYLKNYAEQQSQASTFGAGPCVQGGVQIVCLDSIYHLLDRKSMRFAVRIGMMMY